VDNNDIALVRSTDGHLPRAGPHWQENPSQPASKQQTNLRTVARGVGRGSDCCREIDDCTTRMPQINATQNDANATLLPPTARETPVPTNYANRTY
jgi:hypothetical protein